MNAEHNGSLRVEAEIDAALKILNETQPPAQLVWRTHQRLDAAAVSNRVRSRQWFLIPAVGVVMATVAMVAFFMPMHRQSENQASAIETARMVANTSLPHPTIVRPAAPAETDRRQEGKRSVQFHTERRNRPNHERRHATNLLSYPMTRQEKLLVRFVRNAKLADLQALNPEYQAKVEAQQEAEFAAYLKSGRNSDVESATQTTESTQE